MTVANCKVALSRGHAALDRHDMLHVRRPAGMIGEQRERIGKGWWITLVVVLAMLLAPVAYHAARALHAHTEAETTHVQ